MSETLLRETTADTGGDRRQAIVRALHQCIREQGYARTSLTDIALKAGMSPSHIRYYFDGKEAILRHYFAQLCQILLTRIRAIPTGDPDAWLSSFARIHFGDPRISQSGLAVVVEIFGVAMHDAEMKAIKRAFDDEMRDIMRRFFEAAGCADGLTPDTAAELARAMDIGLKYSTAFSAMKPQELEAMILAGIRRLLRDGKPTRVAKARTTH